MEHVQVRDQSFLGICFAESVAQLYDARRFTNPAPIGDKEYSHQTSAFLIGAKLHQSQRELERYNEKLLNEGKLKFESGGFGALPIAGFTPDYSQFDSLGAGSFDGGTVCETFNALKKYGSYPSLHDEIGTNTFVPFLMNEWINQISNQHASMNPSPLGETVATAAQRVQDCYQYQGLTVEKEKIEAALKDSYRYSIFLAAADTTAKSKPVSPQLQCIDLSPADKTPESFIEAMRKHFYSEQRPIQPLAISICGNLLVQGRNFEGLSKNGAQLIQNENCGPHSLLVIGERFNPTSQHCEFLLRNSWGTQPKGYSKNWEREVGNVWVEEVALSRNMMGIQMIK